MKKYLIPILIAMAVSTAAHAGILGTVGGYVKAEALSVAIGGIIGALGMFGLSYKLWGTAAKELGDCVWAVYKATRPGSDGGRVVTKDEMQKIVAEFSELYPAVAAAIASRKRGK